MKRGKGGKFKKLRHNERFVPHRAAPGWARKARKESGIVLPRLIEAEAVACAGFGGYSAAEVALRLQLAPDVDGEKFARFVAAVHDVAGLLKNATIDPRAVALAAIFKRLIAVKLHKADHAKAVACIAATLDDPVSAPIELSLLEGQVAPETSCLAGLPLPTVRMFCTLGRLGRWSSREIYHAMDLHSLGLSDRSIRTRLLRLRRIVMGLPRPQPPTDVAAYIKSMAVEIVDYLRVRVDLNATDVVKALAAWLDVSVPEADAP